ncbi:MAG: hypothetical protein LBP78_05090 [Acidaminococcales bacterium]|nr:hypothetical protein [Acidaminococcales bacterium]
MPNDNLDGSLRNELKSNGNSAFASAKAAAPLQNGQAAADDEQITKNAASGRPKDIPPVVPTDKAERRRREKPLYMFGVFCLAAFAAVFIIMSRHSTVNTTDAARQALTDKTSTALAAGTILLTEDADIGRQDYTIAHNFANTGSTKVWIWDYAAEDGDYVQVLINGVPVGEPFMIKHKPVELPISLAGLTGTVQVKGVRDGGGGITYAIRYELNNTTYFNSAPENEFNTYTLELAR